MMHDQVELEIGDWDGITSRFLEVKSRIEKRGSVKARNQVFKMPWGFYRTHTPDECVREIMRRCQE